MDLPTQVKNLLNSPETTEASHGEVDHRTPGSFPVDDVGNINESSGPNKLRKRDPRDVSDARTHGHRPTDSGVGLSDNNGNSTQQPTAAGYDADNLPDTNRDIPVDTHSHDQSKTDSLRDTSALGSAPPSHQTTQRGAATEPIDSSTTTGAAALGSQSEASKDTRGPEDVTQDHPYWGDLPRGAGVYNSVTGHGSAEDKPTRQQEIYEQETRDTTGQGISSTQGTSGQHPTTVGDITSGDRSHQQTHGTTGAGLVTGHSTSSHYPTTAGDSIGTQQQTHGSTGLTDSRNDPVKSESQRDTINRQGVIGGTSAATAAAAAAYKLHDRPEEDKTRDTTHDEHKQEKHSGGLFHRKSDDHHKEAKKEDESKHEKHSGGGLFHHKSSDDHQKETKPAEEPKHEKLSGGGLFHHKSSDDHQKETKPAEEPKHEKLSGGGLFHHKSSDDHQKETKPAEEPKHEKLSGGGLFHHKSSDDHHKETKPAEEPKHEKKGLSLGSLFHRGDKKHDQESSDVKDKDHTDNKYDTSNAAAYTTAGVGAGGAAAYIANRGRDDNVEKHGDQSLGGQNQPLGTTQQQPLGSRSGGDSQYDHLASGTSSGVRHDPLTHDSSTTSRDQQYDSKDRDGHHKTAATAATAAGAGLATGAYAHSRGDDRQRDPTDSKYTESSNTHSAIPATSDTTHTSAFAGQTSSRDPLSSTTQSHTTSGLGSNVDPTLGSSTLGGSTSSPHTSKEIPSLAASANHGEYNTLSSGTPSGIKVEDHHTSQHSSLPAVSETKDDGSKSKYAAAGLGAAGLGAAGATAYNSRNKDDELNKLEPVEQQQVKQFEREEAKPRSNPIVGGVPGSSSKQSEPVIHHCQKCGEGNDISSYFKDLKEKHGGI